MEWVLVLQMKNLTNILACIKKILINYWNILSISKKTRGKQVSIAEWILMLPWVEITKVSKAYNVDKDLIAAIIKKESYGDPCATRYEDHYKWLYNPEHFAKSLQISKSTEEIHQKTSWGLMQVMGAVAREMGHEGHIVNLCIPEIGLTYGTKYLKKLIKKYENIEDAIAAYNAGTPRRNETGKYTNQHYVDAVLENLKELK